MQKRELVNLFIGEDTYSFMDDIVDNRKKSNRMHFIYDLSNCFNAKILLIHDSEASKARNISKLCLEFMNEKMVRGKIYTSQSNVYSHFQAEVNGDNGLNISVPQYVADDESKSQLVHMCVQNYLIILTYINTGELALSDDFNRKDRRRIAKNNSKHPEFKVEGDTYKIIDISKQRKYLERKRSEDSLIRQREHMRRGHYRHYKKTGKIVWIDAYKAGDASLGVITKDYKV